LNDYLEHKATKVLTPMNDDQIYLDEELFDRIWRANDFNFIVSSVAGVTHIGRDYMVRWANEYIKDNDDKDPDNLGHGIREVVKKWMQKRAPKIVGIDIDE